VPGNSTVIAPTATVTGVPPAGTAGTSFYVQDPAGGQYSGLFIYDNAAATPAGLAIGDTVTITGTYQEYGGPQSSPWPAPHTESQIIPSLITKTASGATPHIDTVASSNLASLNDTTGDPWESCLIQITGTTTVSSVGYGYS